MVSGWYQNGTVAEFKVEVQIHLNKKKLERIQEPEFPSASIFCIFISKFIFRH